jgi:hypothetical protein
MRRVSLRVLLVLIGGLAACGEDRRLTTQPSPQPNVTPPAPAPGASARSVNTIFLAPPAAAPSSATDPLVGRYQLEIEAGSRSGQRCEAIPGYATRRTYTADVNDLGDRYAVRLYDAAFLTNSSSVSYGCGDTPQPQFGNVACNQFILTGDTKALAVTAQAQDEWRDSEIWEALPDGFLLAITGRATGLARDRRIEATGTGSLWYGNGLPASTAYACQVDALRFTLTPR